MPSLGYLVLGLAFALVACGADENDDSKTSGGSGGSGGMQTGPGGRESGGAGRGTTGSGGSAGRASSNAGSGNAGSGNAGSAGRASGNAGRANAGSGGSGPAPSSEWVNATGNLASMASECGNLTLLSSVPGSGTIIAGVAKVGLFASADGGAHWEALGTGSGSAMIENRPGSVVYDPEAPSTFWESGIYNGPGLFKTTDGGETFTQLGDISHNDVVSVDFTDPERKTLLVGGHEQKQTLYLSRDGGMSFDPIGMNLPAGSHFSSTPLVLDADTFLVGACGYGDGQCGVFRSTDGGDTWDLASELAVAGRPLWASDGAIYWPLIYDGGLALSTDDGATFTQVSDGVLTAYPVELPDGRILSVKGDHVAVTADQGAHWTPIGETLPFKAAGVVYSAPAKTLYVWQWDCGDIVLPDAIATAGFDFETQ